MWIKGPNHMEPAPAVLRPAGRLSGIFLDPGCGQAYLVFEFTSSAGKSLGRSNPAMFGQVTLIFRR